MQKPWEVNPRSKGTSPEILAAYKARTLHLITLELVHGRTGYAWASNAKIADTAAARMRAKPPMGATGMVTVQPYPYAMEGAQ